MTYKFGTGLKKSFKNVVITYILPAVALLIANYTDWLPAQTAVKLAPVMGFVGYLTANYLKHKD